MNKCYFVKIVIQFVHSRWRTTQKYFTGIIAWKSILFITGHSCFWRHNQRKPSVWQPGDSL